MLYVLLLTEICSILCLSWSIRRIRQESLCVFSHVSRRFFPCTVFSKYVSRIWRQFCVPQMTRNLPYSPHMLKYFPQFSEYAQILSAHSPNTQKKFLLSKMHGDFKGIVFRKKCGMNILQISKKFFTLCLYGRLMAKNKKTQDISVNIGLT